MTRQTLFRFDIILSFYCFFQISQREIVEVVVVVVVVVDSEQIDVDKVLTL